MNNNITEDYCSFEVAKLLKDKKFGGWCEYYYDCEGNPQLSYCSNINMESKCRVARPTHALAIKWIRKNFGIHVYPQFQMWDGGCWTANWHLKNGKLWQFFDFGKREGIVWERTKFSSPEKATEAALLYVLQNLII